MTFEKMFDEYIKSPQFKRLAIKSKQVYLYAGRKLGEYFGDKDVQKIKRSDLLKFQQDTAEKPAYSNMTIRVASIVFAYGMDMDYIEHNPASRLKKLRVGSHLKWTVDEVRTVIALDDRKISTAVAIAWYTGQREGDVLSMQWKDFDGEYISVKQAKTGLEMKIKAHPDLIVYLQRIRGDACPTDFIVSGKKLFKSSAFRGMLKRRLRSVEISKVFHGIRKGVASSLAENGSPISEIAAIMGHKSMRMAAYYAEQASNKILTDNAVKNLDSCV